MAPVLAQPCAHSLFCSTTLPIPITASMAGEILDRVDDLGIAGAPAEMRSKIIGDLLPRRISVRFDEGMCSNRNPGNAESALHPAGLHKAFRDLSPRLLGKPLKRRHLLARRQAGIHRAGEPRLTVDQDGAATALAKRLATVLRRSNPESIAQGIEQCQTGSICETHFASIELERADFTSRGNRHTGSEGVHQPEFKRLLYRTLQPARKVKHRRTLTSGRPD